MKTEEADESILQGPLNESVVFVKEELVPPNRSEFEAQVVQMKDVVGVKLDAKTNCIKFRVKWDEDVIDTWETEDNFTGPEAQEALERFKTDAKYVNKYKAAVKKQKANIAKLEKMKGIYERKKPTYEVIEDPSDPEPETFFGLDPEELKGEMRGLYDSSHKFSELEIKLAEIGSITNERCTRSKVRTLREESGSAPTSRTQTPQPCSQQLEVATTPSPTSVRGRGRGRGRGRPRKQTPISQENIEHAKVLDEREPMLDDIADNQSTSNANQLSVDVEVPKPTSARQPPNRNVKRKAVMDDEDEEDGKYVSEIKSSDDRRIENTSMEPYSQLDVPCPTGRRRRQVEGICGTIDVDVDLTILQKEISRKMQAQLSNDFDVDDITSFNIGKCLELALASADILLFRRCCSLQQAAVGRYLQEERNSEGQSFLHRISMIPCSEQGKSKGPYPHALCDFTELIFLAFYSFIEPSLTDKHHKTALHYAIEKCGICRVRRLLAYRAPVNIVHSTIPSPLEMCYNKNSKPLVKAVLDAGACFSTLERLVKKGKIPKQPRSLEEIQKHKEYVCKKFKEARTAVMQDIDEVRSVTPIFIRNFHEGPTFIFNFQYSAQWIPNAEYAFILFIGSAKCDDGKWRVKLWNLSPLVEDPLLNGRNLISVQYLPPSNQEHDPKEIGLPPAVFACVPAHGANELVLKIDPCYTPKANTLKLVPKMKLVVQIMLVRRRIEEMAIND